MTLTPREYLHQHFGEKDRKWIESLSDAECKHYAERYSDATEAPSRRWFARPQRFEELHPMPDVPVTKIPCLHCGEWDTHKLLCCSAGMRLPIEIPGEYPNWR